MARAIPVEDLQKPGVVEELTDAQLKRAHEKLHVLDAKLVDAGMAREYATVHGHDFVIAEMTKRGIEHPDKGDALDQETEKLESVTAATPDVSRGVMIAMEVLDAPEGVDNPHITLAYLGKIGDELKEGDDDRIASALAGVQEVSIDAPVTAKAHFTPGDDGHPCVVILSSAELDDVRRQVLSALESMRVPYHRDHGFIPHMTLAYHDDLAECGVDGIDIKESYKLVGPFFYWGDEKQEVETADPDWIAAVLESAEDEILVPQYISVVGSSVDGQGNDIDVLIRERPELIDSEQGWRESLMLLVRNLFSPDGEKRSVHISANQAGPHVSKGRGYVPTHDLVLRPRKEAAPVTAAAGGGRGFVLLGVGAATSSKHRYSGLLVDVAGSTVILDGLPHGKLVDEADAWLVTSDHGEVIPKQRLISREHGEMRPEIKSFSANGLTIEPKPVEHATDPSVGYEITYQGKRIVWAPRFYRFPEWAKGADLMFSEGCGWDRAIVFTGGTGGHMSMADAANAAEANDVKRLVFVHVGKPAQQALQSGKKPTFGELGVEGQTYALGSGGRQRGEAEQGDTGDDPDPQAASLVGDLRAAGGDGAVEPGAQYQLTKPMGLGVIDFAEPGAMWEEWGRQALEEAGALFVSTKVDGFRLSISHSSELVKIWSEDHKREFSDLPQMEPLRADLQGDIVIEGELLVKVGNEFVARPQIASFLAGKLEGDPFVTLYDILYDGEDIHEQTWEERYPRLKALGDKLGAHLQVLPQIRVTDEEGFMKAVERMGSLKGVGAVEGIVARRADQVYAFSADNAYAKLKRHLELKAFVLSEPEHKQNGWVYNIGFPDPPENLDTKDIIDVDGTRYMDMGRTFTSPEKLADQGQTLNVVVEEVLLMPDGSIALGKPAPQGPDLSRGPYPLDAVLSLAERMKVLKEYVTPVQAAASGDVVDVENEDAPTRGEVANLNWEESWQEAMPLKGLSENFVLHAHWRGLSEDETELDMERLLDTDHSLHYDLRLGTDRFKGWFGITIYAEGSERPASEEQVHPFLLMDDPKLSLGSTTKSFGPAAWLQIGVPEPYVSEPKGVGATSKKFAKFFALDHGTWRLGFARLHALEMWIEGSHLKGRYMWQYAQFGDRRAWVLTRPEDQTPYAKHHDREQVISELKGKGQRWLVWPKDPDDLAKGHDLIDTSDV